MLPECWKKCVDSGGEYVEDWHVQVTVWQIWFKKKSVPVIFEPPCRFRSWRLVECDDAYNVKFVNVLQDRNVKM
jgi:hypothetical protein